VKRQQKDYHVTIGNVDNAGDNPAFGTANVKATDALAAANQVNKNLGKRQYVAAVSVLPVGPPATPYPETALPEVTLGSFPEGVTSDAVPA
jgi:hypothetical protein